MIDLERMAARNEPMPQGLDVAQQMLYQGLRLLYARHREDDVDAETGEQEKAELLRAYEEAKANLELWEAQRKRWVDLAGPAAEFRKAKNNKAAVEAAWKMHEVLYGIR